MISWGMKIPSNHNSALPFHPVPAGLSQTPRVYVRPTATATSPKSTEYERGKWRERRKIGCPKKKKKENGKEGEESISREN